MAGKRQGKKKDRGDSAAQHQEDLPGVRPKKFQDIEKGMERHKTLVGEHGETTKALTNAKAKVQELMQKADIWSYRHKGKIASRYKEEESFDITTEEKPKKKKK